MVKSNAENVRLRGRLLGLFEVSKFVLNFRTILFEILLWLYKICLWLFLGLLIYAIISKNFSKWVIIQVDLRLGGWSLDWGLRWLGKVSKIAKIVLYWRFWFLDWGGFLKSTEIIICWLRLRSTLLKVTEISKTIIVCRGWFLFSRLLKLIWSILFKISKSVIIIIFHFHNILVSWF